MRRIVIKSKVSKCNNKNENIEYKVKYKELIKPSVATKILNETFKYYSRFRLEFKEDEKYKVFDTIFNGEIYKIVVAKSKKDLKENIEKIVSDIGTNTALFVNLYNINIYNMDKEAEKTRDKRSDGERYSKIVKSKEYFTDVNAGVVVFGNFLLKGFLFASGLLSPTLKTILILNYVLSVSAIMTIDLEKLKRDDTTTFENIMLTYVGCVCGGLPLLIDCVAIGVSAAIDYLMGDIKIKLNKVINKFFKKRKTPKNYKGIEKEINEVEQNLKKDMIDLSLINPKENVPTVNMFLPIVTTKTSTITASGTT